MAGRRLLYLTVLAVSIVFYLSYQEWFAWFVLLIILLLPLFSFVISLPAMLTFTAQPEGPAALTMGDSGDVWLMGQCGWPVPPFKGRVKLRHIQSGQILRYRSGGNLPTDHCGGIAVTGEKVWVYDYLGLIGIPVRRSQGRTVLVRPKIAQMEAPDDLNRYLARSWRPKPGGGYAENHDIRLYRPGDSLNQVHWKLTAKTGKLMLREPLQPNRGLILLTMNLRGSPEILDRKCGKLLFLGNYLLEMGISFELRVFSAEGIHTYPIQTKLDLDNSIDHLLTLGCAVEGDIRHRDFAASWLHHIGGEQDEA